MACDHAKCATPFCQECHRLIRDFGWDGLLGYLRKNEANAQGAMEYAFSQEGYGEAIRDSTRHTFDLWSGWAKLVADHLESMKGTP